MHEATIAEAILKIACRRLKETQNAESVSSIDVLIGEFRNVETQSLQFAFDSIKGLFDGLAQCKLNLESIGARAYCQGQEAHQYAPVFEKRYCCDKCGSGMGKLICGEELQITKVCLLAKKEEKPACMKA